MAKKEINTSINISASAQKVWSILTNFDDYENWNPFIKSIRGNVSQGQKIDVELDGMKFKPEVLVFEKEKEFRWKGALLFKGLFDGEHSFHIIDNGDGSVRFEHNEKFSGILVGLFAKKLDGETTDGFIAMNQALKEMAESSI